MSESTPKPEQLIQIEYRLPKKSWLDPKTEFHKGTYNYGAQRASTGYLDLPFSRKWQPMDDDWQLPDNWQEIIREGFKERLDKYRSLKLFMDICVRCGACADKCHFYIGSGDPKNMPVLRAELLRSVYRNDFTTAGKWLGKMVGARELTYDVVREWFYYFLQRGFIETYGTFPSEEEIKQLQTVISVEKENSTTFNLKIKEDVNELIKWLANYDIERFTCEEATLAEIFLHF